ncbi:hypothetical protein CCMA1212_004110 [Trichoderma ghanense]|uniref:Uncharacterized protein n=1 Tax=Trichoderma ghanense TaxID=65468 RepID=A0ABY2H6C7_9HYPO
MPSWNQQLLDGADYLQARALPAPSSSPSVTQRRPKLPDMRRPASDLVPLIDGSEQGRRNERAQATALDLARASAPGLWTTFFFSSMGFPLVRLPEPGWIPLGRFREAQRRRDKRAPHSVQRQRDILSTLLDSPADASPALSASRDP